MIMEHATPLLVHGVTANPALTNGSPAVAHMVRNPGMV